MNASEDYSTCTRCNRHMAAQTSWRDKSSGKLFCSANCRSEFQNEASGFGTPIVGTRSVRDQMIAAGYPVNLTEGLMKTAAGTTLEIEGGLLLNDTYSFADACSDSKLYEREILVDKIDWEHYWFHRGGANKQAAWAQKHPPKKLIDGILCQIDGWNCEVSSMALDGKHYAGMVKECGCAWRQSIGLCSPAQVEWVSYYQTRAPAWIDCETNYEHKQRELQKSAANFKTPVHNCACGQQVKCPGYTCGDCRAIAHKRILTADLDRRITLAKYEANPNDGKCWSTSADES